MAVEFISDNVFRLLWGKLEAKLTEISTVIAAGIRREYKLQLREAVKEIMASIEENADKVAKALDAQAATLDKIKAEVENLKTSNVTTDELRAAVNAAKAAQKTEDESVFGKLVDASFNPLIQKTQRNTDAIAALDALIPDAPPPAPTPEPTPAPPTPEPVPPAPTPTPDEPAATSFSASTRKHK